MKKLLVVLLGMVSFMQVENLFAQQCYEATVVSPSPFMGNNGEIIKLDDGSLWQVKFAYEYLYEYNPTVIVCPSKGKLIIKNKSIDIQAMKASGSSKGEAQGLVESMIVSEFSGLNSGNIYVLANGQIWEQVESWVWTWTWVNPSVIIYAESGGYKMKVENINHPVSVRRIK